MAVGNFAYLQPGKYLPMMGVQNEKFSLFYQVSAILCKKIGLFGRSHTDKKALPLDFLVQCTCALSVHQPDVELFQRMFGADKTFVAVEGLPCVFAQLKTNKGEGVHVFFNLG